MKFNLLNIFFYERGETLDLLDIDISTIFVLRKEEESRNIFSFSFCERLFIIPILLQKKNLSIEDGKKIDREKLFFDVFCTFFHDTRHAR